MNYDAASGKLAVNATGNHRAPDICCTVVNNTVSIQKNVPHVFPLGSIPRIIHKKIILYVINCTFQSYTVYKSYYYGPGSCILILSGYLLFGWSCSKVTLKREKGY